MTMLLCNDCEHICTDDDLKVEFPDIPHLLDRIAPGEPVPYGECPQCGALIHKITPKPGLRGWLSIDDGKFEAQCPFDLHREADLITDDPDEVREFFTRARVDDIACSSTVDFPEEYGMSQDKVYELLDGLRG
jgi:hypothetical protein